MSTLFSFVTVRNPRTPTESETATGFIHLDPSLDTPVLHELVAARQQDPTGARDLMLSVKGSDRVWNRPEDLADAAPGLAELAGWLSRRADAVTWADVEPWVKRLSAEEGLDAGAAARLWDSLAVLTYAGGSPELREQVVWSLRALHLLSYDGPRDDDAVARRLATATPLFPADAHGLTLERTGQEDDGPGDDGPAGPGVTADRERLDDLVAAHEEVTRVVARARDRARQATVQPPYTPVLGVADQTRDPAPCTPEGQHPGHEEKGSSTKAGATAAASRGTAGRSGSGQDEGSRPEGRLVLDGTVRASLSDGAARALDLVQAADGDGLPFVLSRLVEDAAHLGAALASAAPSRRVTRVGSSFFVNATGSPYQGSTRPPGHTGVGLVDDRTPAHYDQFWGSHPSTEVTAGGRCQVRPLGVGDFRRVEQEICCFVPGEVAHIENVLHGETKERSTEHRTVVERFTSFVGEEEKTTQRDTQTTDRFEMEKEVTKTLENDLSFEIGVNVAAQYGPVKITADTKFATSQASAESDKQATTFAKEVTDKTLEKVVSKTREERTTRTTDEFTERNLHRLEAKDDHVVGIYRWVDKVYRAKIVNYGKRLMFEFLVPEPAAFHLHAMAQHSGDAEAAIEQPVDPRTPETHAAYGRAPITSHTSITETNYAFWAAAYGALVDPPPALTFTTSKAYSRADMDHSVQFADSHTDLVVPTGYEAYSFDVEWGLHSANHDGGANWLTIMVGRRSHHDTVAGTFGGWLDSEDDIVPVNVMGRTRFYALNVTVEARRTPQALEDWRLRTYRAVMDGYGARLAAYQTALAEAQTSSGVEIQGNNPAHNRQIEATELQKACLRLLTSCADLPSDAMKDAQEHGYPDFDCCQAIRDGSVVQFFEQLFEWPLITYAFYPYFWGRKSRWSEIYRLDDVDPVFMAFLRAGYARVVVPVRPGYESAALRFLADGSLWDGGAAPGVESPMYVAIENDLKEAVSTVDPSVEPWEITVPTSLTVLQCGSGCVPGEGLPCPCQDEDPADPVTDPADPAGPEDPGPDPDPRG